MKNFFFTTLLLCVFGTLTAFADSSVEVARWKTLCIIDEEGNAYEIPGNPPSHIFTQGNDAFFAVGEGSDDDIIAFYTIDSLQEQNPEAIEGVEYNVYTGDIMSLPEQEDGLIMMYLSKDNSYDIIDIQTREQEFVFMVESNPANRLNLLNKLGEYLDNPNRTDLTGSMKKAAGK